MGNNLAINSTITLTSTLRRVVLAIIAGLAILAGMLAVIDVLAFNSALKRYDSSLTPSAEASIGLTLMAIAIAIAIYIHQDLEAERSELRSSDRLSYLEENVTSAVESINTAFTNRNFESPDPKLDKSLAGSLYRWKSRQDIKQRRILWVDDEPKRIKWERSSIELAGIATIWTGSTESAIELLDGNQFDLVISDMKRGADRTAGLELIEKMREESPLRQTPPIPVIIYSGRATPSHREASKKKGAVDQIADPYELLHCVIGALGERSEK